jgi:hypothetical protein
VIAVLDDYFNLVVNLHSLFQSFLYVTTFNFYFYTDIKKLLQPPYHPNAVWYGGCCYRYSGGGQRHSRRLVVVCHSITAFGILPPCGMTFGS